MAKLVVSFQSHPHVWSKMKLAVVSEVVWQGDVAFQLREGLVEGGDSQVAASGASVSRQKVTAIIGEAILTDDVLLAKSVPLLVGLTANVNLK